MLCYSDWNQGQILELVCLKNLFLHAIPYAISPLVKLNFSARDFSCCDLSSQRLTDIAFLLVTTAQIRFFRKLNIPRFIRDVSMKTCETHNTISLIPLLFVQIQLKMTLLGSFFSKSTGSIFVEFSNCFRFCSEKTDGLSCNCLSKGESCQVNRPQRPRWNKF